MHLAARLFATTAHFGAYGDLDDLGLGLHLAHVDLILFLNALGYPVADGHLLHLLLHLGRADLVLVVHALGHHTGAGGGFHLFLVGSHRALHGLRAALVAATAAVSAVGGHFLGLVSSYGDADLIFLGLGDRFAYGLLANTLLLYHDWNATFNFFFFFDILAYLLHALALFLGRNGHTAGHLLVHICGHGLGARLNTAALLQKKKRFSCDKASC